MKKVFSSNSDVMHVYAQRTQTSGQSGNVFFEGNKIYSYGRHYLLAEFKDIKGETIIVINDRGYSNSTAKHIGKIIGATRQYKQFFTSNIDLMQVYNFVVDNYTLLQRAKKPLKYLDKLISKIDAYSKSPFITTNDRKTPQYKYIQKIFKLISSAENLAKAKEQEKIRLAKANEKAKKQLTTDLIKFENFEINSFRSEHDYLRISADRTKVETSQQVKIDIEDARNLYKAIVHKVDVRGQSISHYIVKSVDDKTLVIGCHKIPMTEVHKIGEQL